MALRRVDIIFESPLSDWVCVYAFVCFGEWRLTGGCLFWDVEWIGNRWCHRVMFVNGFWVGFVGCLENSIVKKVGIWMRKVVLLRVVWKIWNLEMLKYITKARLKYLKPHKWRTKPRNSIILRCGVYLLVHENPMYTSDISDFREVSAHHFREFLSIFVNFRRVGATCGFQGSSKWFHRSFRWILRRFRWFRGFRGF